MYIQDVKSLTKEILDERINATIGKPCIICERPAAVAGIFEPNNSREFGAPPDKIRLIFYPICKKCYSNTALPEIAEAIIQQELSGVTIH